MKNKIQLLGKTLSGMIMPNIGAFITWGLIAALFIPEGWMPNVSLAELTAPMIIYMLPLLIAYTAGKNIADSRGGVTATIASMGVIVGGEIPMFIGVMMMGPFAGWLIQKVDSLLAKRIPAGFEMLVNNFSLGILGLLLAILGYYAVGPFINTFTLIMKSGADWMILHGLLPLVSIFVEPAKVLFLNNAINHGIFSPIGILQSETAGYSTMFLLEANPGPGLGILLAYMFYAKGAMKTTAPGALVIHFFGGIHEIYFPYILINPRLILALILGSASGILFFTMADVGIVAPASPGSIIAIFMMAYKGKWLLLLLGILLSAIVTFVVGAPLVRREYRKGETTDALNAQATIGFDKNRKINKITFACDAGMGSSVMGASRFRSRLEEVGVATEVTHSSVDSIPIDADIVACQGIFIERAKKSAPNAQIISIKNFLMDANLDALFNYLNKNMKEKNMFSVNNIFINLNSEDKDSAIRRAGEYLLDLEYIKEEYIEAMLDREEITSTYMGMGVAIPHGTKEGIQFIDSSGFVLLQYKYGVSFGEEKVYLILAIAGLEDDHLTILSQLASMLADENALSTLINSSDKQAIYNLLTTNK